MKEVVSIAAAPDTVAQDRISQIAPFTQFQGSTNGDGLGFADPFETGHQILYRQFA